MPQLHVKDLGEVTTTQRHNSKIPSLSPRHSQAELKAMGKALRDKVSTNLARQMEAAARPARSGPPGAEG